MGKRKDGRLCLITDSNAIQLRNLSTAFSAFSYNYPHLTSRPPGEVAFLQCGAPEETTDGT